MKIVNKKKMIEKYIQRCQIKDDDYDIISCLFNAVKESNIPTIDMIFNKYEDLIIDRC